MNDHSHRGNVNVDHVLKLSIRSIEDLKWRFRRNPDVLSLLDEQTDLLMENASQVRTQQNLIEMVRKGLLSDMAAAVLSGAVAKAANTTLEKIALNVMIIKHVMNVQDHKQVIEA